MTSITAEVLRPGTLPTIDLSRLEADDVEVRASEARALRAACVGHGFFYLVNHSVPVAEQDDAFYQARQFFDLPLAVKMAVDAAQSPVLRGYTPLLAENTDPTGRGDLHEGFDIGGVLFDGSSGAHLNRYPDALPSLEPAMNTYWDAMVQLSRSLMGGFALALDLPRDHFEPLLDEPQAFLRILHYPSQDSVVDARRIGIGAHTDYESFTILAQDENPALQVSDGQGGWIWAQAQPGTFVVNIGDQMARWTNDLFRSTLHRAINQTGRRRYSIPFFFGPNPNAVIEVLPGCSGPDRPALYPPVRAGDYSRQRLEASYGRGQA